MVVPAVVVVGVGALVSAVVASVSYHTRVCPVSAVAESAVAVSS